MVITDINLLLPALLSFEENGESFTVFVYIDQKKSWSSAWDNFENLGQYENWKSTIVKYHVGLLTPRHFELEKDKFDQKTKQKEIDHQVERYSTALEIVSSYTPEVKTTLSEEKFEAMTEEIRKDLKELSEEQEKILDELAKTQSEKSYLENQLIILRSCVEELDKDYVYAYENIEGDTLECPLCATQHDNNIFNKASILADKAKAESQLEEIKTLLDKAVKKYNNASKNYDKTKSRITEINNKYVIPEENNNNIKLSDVIENIAGNSIKENVIKAKEEKIVASDNVAKEIKDLTKQQKELLTDEEKEAINNSFVLKFTNYTKALNATSVNASEINSPLDYNKVVKEGGAAESTRAILAYYLSVFALINNAKSEVLAPFVIDTPNQQEQSLGNYDKIIELIFTELAEKTQVFMCAMENSLLAPFQENGKVITLDDKKLLSTEQYEKTAKAFASF